MTKTQRIACAVFFALGFAWVLSQTISIHINLSESLPQKAFLVLKGVSPHKDNYVAFWPTGNGFYSEHRPFIKQVAGEEGSKVSIEDGWFLVDNVFIGKAKSVSKTGVPLEVGPIGQLGKGEYFVYSKHPDSLDSRYANIGWVNETQVLGRAWPLF